MHAWGKLTVAAVTGALFGLLSSASNQVETPLAFILNAGWAWAGAVVLAGWIAKTRPLGAATGVLAGMAAVLAYYGADSILRGEPFTTYISEITYWAIAIVLMGPGLGAIGATLRGPWAHRSTCRPGGAHRGSHRDDLAPAVAGRRPEPQSDDREGRGLGYGRNVRRSDRPPVHA